MGVSKDGPGLPWFETAQTRLLTMRSESHHAGVAFNAVAAEA